MIEANRSDHTAARGAMSSEVKGGLEDVVVSTSDICFIDGQRGRLLYRGYDVNDLVEHSSFEEVVYLLWHSALPRRQELDAHVKMPSGGAPTPFAVFTFDFAHWHRAVHEFNASSFAARGTAATMSDLHSAITSAIGALKGPLDGGANEQVMGMVELSGAPERAEGWIRKALGDKARVMGFGHRVYRVEDPRAKHLRRLALELGQQAGDTRSVEILNTVARVVTQEKHIYPNVDLYSGAAYKSMGIPTDQFTPIFAISRVAGWAAHVMEQHANNRLIRPRAEYTGPTHATYVPIDRR